MKRDPRLRLLSSDHHQALVMVRKIQNACKSGEIDLSLIGEVRVFCMDELKPHFALEENHLLPILSKYGEHNLVARTLSEHEQMMNLATHLEQKSALQQLSVLLKQHVKFEEQVLFDIIQKKFSGAELNRVCSHFANIE